ncbi:DUF927 domain-containing protein [Serratia oryzae]|uniref:DUF927 domain-containing protein n=1 Tax=Serratia oryzae TaxID=2034155 RepID=UPI0012E277EA|nr:DUF927 domain-containing protein [Serratia oryzae]
MTEKKVKLYASLLALSTMERDTDIAYRYVKFYSQNQSQPVKLLFAATDIDDERRLRQALVSKGLRLDLDKKTEWKAIHKELRKNVEERVRLCTRPGFAGRAYLNGSAQTFGNEKGHGPLPYPGSPAFHYDEQERGELEDWQTKVVPLALHSSRLILGLCSAFAGPCLHLTGIESGGFHFYGPSSTGKSTLMLMAASVFGSSRFVKKWSITEAGFEQVAEARNDSLLLLDELKLLGKNKNEAAEKAQNCIYMLGSGEGKQRHSGYQKAVSRWRLVMLSTGEFSLGQHADEGNLTRLDGERVRVVDVPADAGADFGIFDTVPEKLTPPKLAERIQSRCGFYHGTAGPAFITKMLKEKKKSIKKKLNKHIGHFMARHKIDKEDGIAVRIAKRFALVYASGVLANEYGILPLTEKEIMEGISSCYRDACNTPMKGFDFSDEFKAAFDSHLLDLQHPPKKRYTKEELDKIPIIQTIMGRNKDKKPVYAVNTAFFDKNVEGDTPDNVTALLREEGILNPDSDGKKTRSMSYQKIKLARRYCLYKDKFDAWLADE